MEAMSEQGTSQQKANLHTQKKVAEKKTEKKFHSNFNELVI